MADIIFTIPSNREELLNVSGNDGYVVQTICPPKDIISSLQVAKTCFRDEGPNFILDNFDVYFSVLHQANRLQVDVIHKAYEDLCKAVKELNNGLQFLLDDRESLNDEIKMKTLNVLKMLLYMYTQFVQHFENEQVMKQKGDLLAKGRKGKKDDNVFSINRSQVLLALNNILQHEISTFWDPPVVDENFINMISHVCFCFLYNPAIKYEKELKADLFGLFGNLIKSFNYGSTFVIRLIQTVKMYEHVVSYLPEGIKILVDQYGCGQIVHHVVREATEWQADESNPDAQGSRFCALFLSELAALMPDLIIPEITYMNRYLNSDSVPLRNSVLNMMTEVISNVLTKHDLNETEKELRDDLLNLLLEHTKDVSAIVRSRVIQNLSKLQKENAIPVSYQPKVLKEVIPHLRDKGNNVRKAAVNCLTTFVSHNVYGAVLQLKNVQEELAKKKEAVNQIESTYKEAQMAKLEEIEKEWSDIKYQLKETIEKELDNDEDEEDDDDDNNNDNDKETGDKPETPQFSQLADIIRLYLKNKQFTDAFKLCQKLLEDSREFKEMLKNSNDNEIDSFMAIFHSIFFDMTTLLDELRLGVGMSAEDITKLESLKKSLAYYEAQIEFLQHIDEAMRLMKDMLFTKTITDMHEAIQFFITACKFQLDNSFDGVLEMLKLMKYNEQDRKDAVVQAFKTIYLETDATDMSQHAATIVNRLADFLKLVPAENFVDFQDIVAKWAAQGIIDNSVIDMCWHYFTKRMNVSDDRSRGAVELLRMASIGRKTIITKNIKVVASVAISERGSNDMLFLASALKFLAVAGRDKINIEAKDPPLRIKHVDPMFEDLSNIIVENFDKPVPYYQETIEAAINFIFKMCSKPMDVCEKLFRRIYEKLVEKKQPEFVMVRFCSMLGCTARDLLGFLDDTVYRELKRRNHVREERKRKKGTAHGDDNNQQEKQQQKSKKKNNNSNSNNNASGNRKRMSRASASVLDESSLTTNNDDTVLDGAQAEDTDAEFILNVLENDVAGPSSFLGQFSPLLIKICSNPHIYDSVYMQGVAVTALIRYMLVSSKFCEANIRLLFTILKATPYADVKGTIVMHCSDLLTRFPNIVEPWTPKIYESLNDDVVDVRKNTFFALSSLILRDMIRMHSHISKMALCLIDPDDDVCAMCRTFFAQLAQKENNLSNVLPDIFSHVSKIETMTDENVKYIMKYLFTEYADNNKRVENLVDRFCGKFCLSEDVNYHRQIAYCLSLMSYNDKALRKLHEKFPTYKHLVHDQEIYNLFKQILAECSKPKVGRPDLKPIVTEIENAIQSVFEINEDGQQLMPPPPLPKTTTRKNNAKNNQQQQQQQKNNNKTANSKRNPRAVNNRTTRKNNRNNEDNNSSDDDDDDVNESNGVGGLDETSATPLRGKRTRPNRTATNRRRAIESSSSGSD